MASSKRPGRRVPPSYEETMEELARKRSGENPKHDPTSPGQGVYRKRTDVDDVGYDEAGTTPQYQSDQPATISHTTVKPNYQQHDANLMPQTSTATSPSPEHSRGSPKKSRFKKLISRSTSKRDPNTYIYENQQSVDYWSSIEPVTIDPNIEPILVRPMVTRIGPDGRTYLRDTSIVVVQPEDHETPNTQKVVERPIRPNDYMWYSFVGMAFCFIFGIFSLIRSKEVPVKFEAGDYEGAQKSSTSARNWGTLALISGAVIIIVFLFLLFVSPCPLTRTLQFQGICPEGV
nr:uncharacterized protein LOC129259126 isoform X1 [Lytechinus pictus]